jgi:hypothetical protein
MKWFAIKIIFLLSLAMFVHSSIGEGATRIVVVGDTGTGERAYAPGFIAVQKAMREKNADALLHLGDFVYQPDLFPQSCPDRYIKEIKETLSDPYPIKLFVAGDNDLPPKKMKPKASGCWDKIDPLDSGFDTLGPPSPRAMEGTRVIGNALIGVINNYPWQDPTSWLAPRIKESREKGMWIILAIHEPAITTTWYLDKRETVLKQLNALKPDLVLAGNQHAYERFHLMSQTEEGVLKIIKSVPEKYRSGDGTMHIVSGGGGATFKPFADQQNIDKYTAPKDVFDALANRALMNHFITLDVSKEKLEGIVWRVCVQDDPDDEWNPRWKAGKKFWYSIPLECDGKPEGVSVYETFGFSRQ